MPELTLPRVEGPETSPEGPTTVPGANPILPIWYLASTFYKFLTMSTNCQVCRERNQPGLRKVYAWLPKGA